MRNSIFEEFIRTDFKTKLLIKIYRIGLSFQIEFFRPKFSLCNVNSFLHDNRSPTLPTIVFSHYNTTNLYRFTL